MLITNKTKVTLYHAGCNCHNEFHELNQFLVRKKLPFGNLIVKRVELNPDWQKERQQYSEKIPFVVFENDDEKFVIEYKKLLEEITETTQ